MDPYYDNKIKEMEYAVRSLKNKYDMEEQSDSEKKSQIEKEMIIEKEKQLKNKQKEYDMKIKLDKLRQQKLIDENKKEEEISKCNLEKMRNLYKFEKNVNKIENEYMLNINREKYETEDELAQIQLDIDKSKKNHDNEIFQMNNDLKLEINHMNKDLDLYKQITNNSKTEEIYKLDTYKEIELKKQQIQNQQMLNFLRAFRTNMINNNNNAQIN